MVSLGIDRVDTKALNKHFLRMADTLTNGKRPEEVWAVYYLGRMLAVYLTSDDAFDALEDVMRTLKAQETPREQTVFDAAAIWEEAEKSSLASECNTLTNKQKIKLVPM